MKKKIKELTRQEKITVMIFNARIKFFSYQDTATGSIVTIIPSYHYVIVVHGEMGGMGEISNGTVFEWGAVSDDSIDEFYNGFMHNHKISYALQSGGRTP